MSTGWADAASGLLPSGWAWSVAMGGFALLAILYLGSNWMPVPPIARFFISEFAYLVPLVGSTTCGLLLRGRTSGAESRFWLLLSSASGVMILSELYYIWWITFVSLAGPPPVYAPFQIMHAVAAVLITATLLSMTRFGAATLAVRARWMLDATSALAIVFVAIFVLLVSPLLAGVRGVLPIERVFGAAYPAWGVAMIVGTLVTLLGLRVASWRPWERMVALSLCVYAAGIAAWPLWLVTFKTQTATLEKGALDLVLVGGHYLLFIATLSRLFGAGQQWPLRPMPLFQPGRDRRLAAIVPALSLVCLPLFTVLALGSAGDPTRYLVYLTAATVLGLAMVARSTIVGVENGRLLHRAVTDAITGLFNLRFLHERLQVETDLAKRFAEKLSLIVLDIDDFERVNDRFGHPAGDELLRVFGEAVRSACRDGDIVCRIGGDEFAVILPETGTLEALKIALRVQQEVRAIPLRDSRALTVSMGVATYPDQAEGGEDLIRFAQGARYWVKRHGKDHVLVYDPAVVSDLDDASRIRALETRAHMDAVRALAAAVDARDGATQHHSVGVAALAAEVARELGLDEARVALIESAALLHDVGKIGVPDAILGKPAALSDEEYRRVIEHSALGERILSSTPERQMLPWVRHHHERWDGAGYPDRLRAIEIPLEARILAVCDAFEAMTADRPYRPAMGHQEAVAELLACSGTQFDPAVVEVFVRRCGTAPEAG